MSPTDTIRQHIEIVEGAGGPKPRIAGSRIRVQDIVIWHEKLGLSPDEIVREHPTITLADIHAALAYYWDNRDAIEQRIADADAFAAEMERKYPSKLKEKLERHRNY